MKGKSTAVVLSALLLSVMTGCSSVSVAPQKFASPAEALQGLEEAVAARSREQAQSLVGSQGSYLLDSGDPVLDKNRAQKFIALFSQRHQFDLKPDGSYVLAIGEQRWPFPVPLVQNGNSWFFDAAAGKEEILNRTIGQNELSALGVARTIYLAQRQYALTDWDNDGTLRYAGRIISTPEKKDGLYWPTVADSAEESPLGPAVAQAADENYVITPNGEPQPFHGYYHRIVYSPPTQAPAALDPLTRPGSYWLVSTPASWGESGIMTFVSDEHGRIYEKNLGADADYNALAAVKVDDSWNRVE